VLISHTACLHGAGHIKVPDGVVNDGDGADRSIERPAMPAARRSIKWSFPKLRELTIGKPPSLGRNSLSSVRW
jgi:hypothetical protein